VRAARPAIGDDPRRSGVCREGREPHESAKEMLNRLRKIVSGSVLEGPARRLYRALKGSSADGRASEWASRSERDMMRARVLLEAVLGRDSNCVDVGAHGGRFLDLFLEFAPDGEHYAFEPIPLMADGLRRRYPRVKVLETALGDESGETDFYIARRMKAWSGLRKQPYPSGEVPDVIRVRIERLDTALPAAYSPALIKIDVEGAEMEVLEGAAGVLKRARPVVIFEHAKIHNTEYDTDPGRIFGLLEEDLGMDIYTLDLRGPLSMERLEDIYERSDESGYDSSAETNFVAWPSEREAPSLPVEPG